MHPEENGAVADRFAKQNALTMMRLSQTALRSKVLNDLKVRGFKSKALRVLQ